VDAGSVRVGVAACDPHAVLAYPLETVRRDERGGSDIARLAALVKDCAAIEVVFGFPRSLSGGEGTAATVARAYAERVARRVAPVPVRLVDERFSTVVAHRSLRDAGMGGRRRRPVVDQAAAVIILQAALDAERASGSPPGVLVVPGGGPDGPGPDGHPREAGSR
jgi:putative Holliday junction resolvase